MERTVDFKKILFPTDFTEPSKEALQYALSLARRYSARLYVVHVVNFSDEAAGFYVPHISFERLDEEMKQRAEGLLKSFCKEGLREFKDYESVLLEGEPYKEIVRFVEKENIDIIVMVSYCKEGLDRFLFGSTTERVIRKTDCPVLIVHPSK